MARPSTWSVALIAVLATAAMCGGLWAIPAVREAVQAALQGDLGRLRRVLDGNELTAGLILFGLAMIHVVIPFPAEIPNTAAGFALGIVAGLPVMLAAWTLSGLAAYGLARLAGRPVLASLLGERRIEHAERVVGKAGPTGLLLVRLVPLIPFSLISFVCGITRVPLRRYAWTTTLGTLPLTLVCVILGTRLQTPSLEDPVIWLSLGGIALLIAIAHPLSRRLGAS